MYDFMNTGNRTAVNSTRHLYIYNVGYGGSRLQRGSYVIGRQWWGGSNLDPDTFVSGLGQTPVSDVRSDKMAGSMRDLNCGCR